MALVFIYCKGSAKWQTLVVVGVGVVRQGVDEIGVALLGGSKSAIVLRGRQQDFSRTPRKHFQVSGNEKRGFEVKN